MPQGRKLLPVFQESEDQALGTCTTCPNLCRWSCPVAEAEAKETSAPHRMMIQSGLLKAERITAASVGEAPYHCTGCGACTKSCLHDVDVPFNLMLARNRVLSSGAAPAAVQEVVGHFGVAGNAQGISLEPALESIAESAGYGITRTAETVYFPGCGTLAELPDAAMAFLRGATLAGATELKLTAASGTCCGLPLLWAGELEGFKAHATRFAAQFHGARTLVVHEPSCYQALATIYPRFGIDLAPRVVGVLGFLAPHLDLSKMDGEEGPQVAYLDQCQLDRGMKEVTRPRHFVRRLARKRPIELPELTCEEADCCGASGLLPQVAPQTARAMAEARIQAFRESGADELTMLSPRCVKHLRSVDPSLPVYDLTTLLSRL